MKYRKTMPLLLFGTALLIGSSLSALAACQVEPASSEDKNGIYGAAYEAAGYKVTLTYTPQSDAEISSVQMYGTFQFYTQEDVAIYEKSGYPKSLTTIVPKTAYEYEEGMVCGTYNAPGMSAFEYADGISNLHYDMTLQEDGTYLLSMPIAPGAYSYTFLVTYADGSSEKLYDIDNPPLSNPDTGAGANYSYFLVGNAQDAADGQEYIYPVEEEFQGTVVFDSVMASSGIQQDFAIYLPYDYSEEKTYKVVYVSHGSHENETIWMGLGYVPNLMDNLVQQGLVSDTLVVAMNNNLPFENLSSNESLEAAARNLATNLAPYIEEKYHASSDPMDRAIAGSSAGGSLAANVLITIPEEFHNYGIFSVGRDFTIDNEAAIGSHVRFYASCLDFRTVNTRDNLCVQAQELGISDVSFTMFDGAHDWCCWRAALADFIIGLNW